MRQFKLSYFSFFLFFQKGNSWGFCEAPNTCLEYFFHKKESGVIFVDLMKVFETSTRCANWDSLNCLIFTFLNYVQKGIFWVFIGFRHLPGLFLTQKRVGGDLGRCFESFWFVDKVRQTRQFKVWYYLFGYFDPSTSNTHNLSMPLN